MKTTLSIAIDEYDSFAIICKDYDFKHEIIEHNKNIVRVQVEVCFPSELYFIGTIHQIQKSIVKDNYNNL